MNKTANLYRPVRTSVELSGKSVQTRRCPPPPDLAEYVMDYWQYDVDPTLDYVPVQVFPSGCVVVRFNIRPDHVESVLYGPSLHNHMVGLFYHDWVIVGAALYPQRAYNLLGLSLHELRELRILLECFWPQLIRDVANQMWETQTFAERCAVMSAFFRQILRTDLAPDAGFLNMFQDIVKSAPHAEDIGYIAKRHGASGRTLRRRFNKYLGIGPKQIDRLVRVQNSMRQICGHPNPKIADIALENGFSDQAHLTREFRSLTSLTPKRFASLKGLMHDKSLDEWGSLDTRHRFSRSPDVIRFE